MKNRFAYGGIVSGEAFCNRQKEKPDLRRAIQNHEKLFVFSERRFGKTSLLQAVLGELPRRSYVGAYGDLWPTDSETAFVSALAKAIAASMTSSVSKLLSPGRLALGVCGAEKCPRARRPGDRRDA